MKPFLSALVVAWLAAGIARAKGPGIEAFAVLSQIQRTVDLGECYDEYKQYEKSRTIEAESRRSELKKRIAYIEDPRNPYFAEGSFDWQRLKIGTIGRIDERLIDVVQTLDGHSAITEFPYYVERIHRHRPLPDGRFSSERGAATGSNGRGGTTIMLRNVETAGWVDRESRLISGVFVVDGTERYNTALGSNTVFVLKQLDIKGIADKFTRKSDLRKWTSTGGHETSAVFVRLNRGDVTLYKPDGKFIDVPLEKLSQADKEFVRLKVKELAVHKYARPKRR